MNSDVILIGHGSGGRLTFQLIRELFQKEFGNSILNHEGDSAILPDPGSQLAFTTDSFVIDPVFFPGGNIGKLSVCGTVNDLCVAGAIPKYISVGMIIEEGFQIANLRIIAQSIANEAKIAGVVVVTGDTKVVKRGQCDKIYINTSGIGVIPNENSHLSNTSGIQAGDKIIITGTLGDHAISVLTAREKIKTDEILESDAASLVPVANIALKKPSDIVFMRDLTRGGLATALNEICSGQSFGMEIYEENIPVKKVVKSICDLYGYDPVYLANEGKIVIIVKADSANRLLKDLHSIGLSQNASIIGEVIKDHPSKVVMKSSIGGRRILDMLSGEMLPRIC